MLSLPLPLSKRLKGKQRKEFNPKILSLGYERKTNREPLAEGIGEWISSLHFSWVGRRGFSSKRELLDLPVNEYHFDTCCANILKEHVKITIVNNVPIWKARVNLVSWHVLSIYWYQMVLSIYFDLLIRNIFHPIGTGCLRGNYLKLQFNMFV